MRVVETCDVIMVNSSKHEVRDKTLALLVGRDGEEILERTTMAVAVQQKNSSSYGRVCQSCTGLCGVKMEDIVGLAYVPKPITDEELWQQLESANPEKTASGWPHNCQHKHHMAYSSYFAHVAVTPKLIADIEAAVLKLSTGFLSEPPKILEVGGGLGLLARLIKLTHVSCTDVFDPEVGLGWDTAAETYCTVEKLEASEAVRVLGPTHNILMLVWPLLDAAYAWQSLTEFADVLEVTNRTGAVLYIGEEGELAQGAGARFFEILSDLFERFSGPQQVEASWTKLSCVAAFSVYTYTPKRTNCC